MNETEVRPALTPEEWNARKRPQYYRDQPSITARGESLSIGQDERDGDDWVPGESAVVRDAESRHALAALALHKQPFGFTREDVEELLRLGTGYGEAEIGSASNSPTKVWLRGLAARIAALLPPE